MKKTVRVVNLFITSLTIVAVLSFSPLASMFFGGGVNVKNIFAASSPVAPNIEFVENGTFDTDASGWNGVDGVAVSYDSASQAVKFDNATLSGGAANLSISQNADGIIAGQTAVVLPGQTYVISLDVVSVSASGMDFYPIVMQGGTALTNISAITATSSGSHTFTFTPAQEGAIEFRLWVLDSKQGQIIFDNISLQGPDNFKPVIQSPDNDGTFQFSVNEGSFNVGTVQATDAGPTGSDTITYSIVGGADQARFSIDSVTGDLEFNTAPDYESPQDANGDNVYEVDIQAKDNHNPVATDVQSFTVTVLDVSMTMDSAETGDTDANGKIDYIDVAFSLPVNASSLNTANFDFEVFELDGSGGEILYTITGVQKDPNNNGSGNVVRISFQEHSSYPQFGSSGATPTVRLKPGESIISTTAGEAVTGAPDGSTTVVAQDKVAPYAVEITPAPTPTNLSSIPVSIEISEAASFFFNSSGSNCGAYPPFNVSQGSNTINLNISNDGTYNCILEFTDANNNSSLLNLSQFVYDAGNPSVTVEQAPSQNDPITDPAVTDMKFLITFNEPIDSTTFTTSDIAKTTTGTLTVTNETLADQGGNIWLYTATVSGDGTLTVTLPAGVVQDLFGNGNDASTSNDNQMTRNTLSGNAPSTPDLLPASDTGISDSDNLTNDTTPEFGIASCVAGETVKIYSRVPGNPSYTERASGVCSAQGDIPSIAVTVAFANDGAYEITATSTDAGGNESAHSVPLGINIDTQGPTVAPSIDSITVDGGDSSTDFITYDTGLTFDGSKDAGDYVEFLINGVLETTINPGSNTWQYVRNTLFTHGTYTLSIRARDNAGNTLSGADKTLKVDTEIGTPTFTSPSAGDTTSGLPTFSGTVGGNFDPGDIVEVHTFGAANVLCSTTVATDGSWSCTPSTALSSGQKTVYVHTRDVAGNNTHSPGSDPSVTFTVQNNAPAVTVVTHVPSFTNDNTPDIVITSDQDGTISVGGQCSLPAGVNTSITANTNTTVTLDTLADGAYASGDCTVSVTGTTSGQTGTTPLNAFVIDTQAPTATVNLGINQSDITQAQFGVVKFTVSFDEYMDDTSVAPSVFSVNSGNITTVSKISNGNPADFEVLVHVNSVPDGTIVLTTLTGAQGAQDRAGNGVGTVVNTNNDIVVDRTTPTYSVVNHIPQYTNDNTPSFTIDYSDATDGSVDIYNCGNFTPSPATVSSGSNIAITTTQALPDGLYGSCSFKITDAAGNTTATVVNLNDFTVDTTAPVPTITAPAGTITTTPINFTLTFPSGNGIDPNTLTQSDFTVTNGSVTSITPGTILSDHVTSFTVAVNPTATGAVTLNLLANSVSDKAGNQNTSGASATATYGTGGGGGGTPGITVAPQNLTVSESGTSAVFTVVLDTQPSDNVIISVSSSSTGEATASPNTLTFTASNWNTPQVVTVTGVNDNIVDGDQAVTIILDPAISNDSDYDGLNPADVSVTNTDNDVAGITVSPTNLTVSESGTSASFTVVLNSQPSADVTIPITSLDTTEATVSPASVTFTSSNWSTPQTVTIVGVNDAITDGDQTVTISVGVTTSADSNYDGIDPNDVSVTNTDDDTAGITVSPTSVTVSEDGTSANFTVVLTSAPTAGVTIALSSTDTGEVTVSPTSLTFTSANWNTPQAVTVTGIDDTVVDGAQTVTIQTAPASSPDSNYDGLNPDDVTVVNNDNDSATPANIIVNAPAQISVDESGTTETFTIALSTAPSAAVTIPISSSDTGEITVNPTNVVFDATNWNTPQVVTLTGQDDYLDDGDKNVTIVIGPATSTDSDYDGLDPQDLTATNTDNDTAGLIISAVSGNTREDGTTATFTVVLKSEPSADVVVPVSSQNTNEVTVSPASLTFTPSNWNTPQTVTLTGVDDDIADGDKSVVIQIDTIVSTDISYGGINPSDSVVVNEDDDVAGMILSAVSGNTNENGVSATFTITLESEPTANVEIPVSSQDIGEVTVSPASLTFTPSNWNTPQTVTLTGVDDSDVDGNQSVIINVGPATSSDTDYDGINSTVSVLNEDNDVASGGGSSGSSGGSYRSAGYSSGFARMDIGDDIGFEFGSAYSKEELVLMLIRYKIEDLRGADKNSIEAIIRRVLIKIIESMLRDML